MSPAGAAQFCVKGVLHRIDLGDIGPILSPRSTTLPCILTVRVHARTSTDGVGGWLCASSVVRVLFGPFTPGVAGRRRGTSGLGRRRLTSLRSAGGGCPAAQYAPLRMRRIKQPRGRTFTTNTSTATTTCPLDRNLLYGYSSTLRARSWDAHDIHLWPLFGRVGLTGYGSGSCESRPRFGHEVTVLQILQFTTPPAILSGAPHWALGRK
jgi:hypothetical protein